jgi:hypothetical protein
MTMIVRSGFSKEENGVIEYPFLSVTIYVFLGIQLFDVLIAVFGAFA